MVLRRVGVLSAGKILGAMYVVLGLFFGGIFTLMSLIGATAMMAEGGEGALGSVLFGVGAIIIFPIFYGVMGFISGLIGALLYNGLAGMIGGIELELEQH